MIQTERYFDKDEEVWMVYTHSDEGYIILQNGTGIKYAEAYDPEKMNRSYTETDEKIPVE